MRARTRLLPILALAVGVAGCGPEPETITRQYLAFGTLVELTIRTADTGRAERAAQRLRPALQDWHRQWHPWAGDGLARINRSLTAGRSAAVNRQMAAMLREAAAIHERSAGLFDPAIGGLVRLWGFHDDEEPPRHPPAEAAIQAWRHDRPRMTDLRIADGRVSAPSGNLQLDLGGFAKGYALDQAVELLRKQGVEHAIVNAGGDLRAIGRHGDRPWRVGIRDPRGEGILAAVEAADGEAVFTSGDYERFFEWQGRRYHHILDPRTGRPARGLTAVTVIAGSGARADAAATALFVAGRDWPRLARDMALDQVMVITEEGDVKLTETMAERVRFVGERPASVETVSWQ